MTVVLERVEMRAALRALNRARRARRLRNVDWIDTLYRAYVIGLGALAAIILLAAVVGDAEASRSTLARVREDGAAVAGLAVAIGVALGLRSGAHGGPLVYEAPEVQHVLLAPIARGIVVRTAAFRQLRGVVAMGALGGAVLGALAGPRLSPGGAANVTQWVLWDVAFGVGAALAVWSGAVVASSVRLRRSGALLVGLALVAWSVADLVAHTMTSPLTWLGTLAVDPLGVEPVGALGVAVVAAALLAGFALAGRASLEPALTRARLVSALRFAATVQDIRAVIVLRRQLAHEQPRARPWFRLRTGAPTGRAEWRRDWQGILRWPGARVGRSLALAVVAGASCGGAVCGTTPLVAVAILATYVVALDAVEGLAQEIDHPDRANDLPIPPGALYERHLAVPVALLAGYGLLAAAVATLTVLLVPGADPRLPGGALVVVVVVMAVAATGSTGVALSAYLGRPGRDLGMLILHPGIVASQQFAPLVLVAIAFAPLVVALEVRPLPNPTGAALTAALPALVIAYGIFSFLRSRRPEVA